MEFVKRFIKWGVCGLDSSYYWRTFLWGSLPILLALGILFSSLAHPTTELAKIIDNLDITNIILIIFFILGSFGLMFCYPFGKYVWDSIMESLFPSESRPTIIIFSRSMLIFFWWAWVIRYCVLMSIAPYVMPFVWIHLYRENKRFYMMQEASY